MRLPLYRPDETLCNIKNYLQLPRIYDAAKSKLSFKKKATALFDCRKEETVFATKIKKRKKGRKIACNFWICTL